MHDELFKEATSVLVTGLNAVCGSPAQDQRPLRGCIRPRRQYFEATLYPGSHMPQPTGNWNCLEATVAATRSLPWLQNLLHGKTTEELTLLSGRWTGAPAQVEWAERIRARVGAEFDRVAAAFHAVAQNQDPAMRGSTIAVIAILEDKRDAVMRNKNAGYFIHDWQDIHDQVRKMIFSDPRYQAILIGRAAARQTSR